MRAFRSTSAIRKAHGSAAPTRTPTDCCDSIFRKAPISACITPRRSPPWPKPSTPGRGRLSTGKHPQRRLTSGFHRLTKTVLRRPFESALYHLVGAGEERGRDREAEGFGRTVID